jgi:hypothetical protein
VSQWTFVACAYAVALVGTVALVAASYAGMRRAEAAAAAVKDDR